MPKVSDPVRIVDEEGDPITVGNPLPVDGAFSISGTVTVEHICGAVVSSGGKSASGIARSVDRGITALTTNSDTSLYPLIAIRKRAGYEGANIVPTTLDIMCVSTAEYRWALLLNPTVVGTAFSFTAVTNSAVEADVVRTNATTVTGGIQLASDYGQQNNNSETSLTADLPSKLRLGVSIAGVADILVLAVQRITGTTESFFATMQYREEF